MSVRLIYQMFTKLLSWMVLHTHSDTANEIEILVLRSAATRGDHVRPAITAGQRPRPDFRHPHTIGALAVNDDRWSEAMSASAAAEAEIGPGDGGAARDSRRTSAANTARSAQSRRGLGFVRWTLSGARSQPWRLTSGFRPLPRTR